MNIAGGVKQVPDTWAEKRLTDSDKTVDRDSVDGVMNEIDEYAVDIDDTYVQRFHSGLMHLMDQGLLCYEGQIALYVGTENLHREFQGWAKRVRAVGPWASESGEARLIALSAAGL